MCVICAKPAGVPMPDDSTIRTMWANNPDGAGLMWADGKAVHISKGLMTLDDLYKALKSIASRTNLDAVPVVLHFRIATHGGVNKACTHPFPLSAKAADLTRTKTTCGVGIAHNGIIHSVTPRKGWSDTMEYIAARLVPLADKVPDWYTVESIREIIGGDTHSRLAVLDKSGALELIGLDWVRAEDGCNYSNDSFRPRTWTKWTGWDWDNDGERVLLSPVDGYIIDDTGEMYDGDDLYIDRSGHVWGVSDDFMTAYEWPGARAYTWQGTAARYDEDSAMYFNTWGDWEEGAGL